MAEEENAKSNKTTKYLINLALLLLASYLVYTIFQNHQPIKNELPKEIELAKINDYGAQAYIGNDLKHLFTYDVKLPFVEGVFVVVTKGGHMIFTMNSNVEVSINDEATIQFKKDGINILSGEITINHPSGKSPVDFHVFRQDKLIDVIDLPATIR